MHDTLGGAITSFLRQPVSNLRQLRRVTINGRVSSLLEVGTGFHQELTGRENVYLNGAVLGMSKQEIDRKFDETCPELVEGLSPLRKWKNLLIHR